RGYEMRKKAQSPMLFRRKMCSPRRHGVQGLRHYLLCEANGEASHANLSSNVEELCHDALKKVWISEDAAGIPCGDFPAIFGVLFLNVGKVRKINQRRDKQEDACDHQIGIRTMFVSDAM